MLQIVKADLTGILALFADYRPQLDPDSLALDIFLARREKSYLFPVEDVYLAESYANLCWTAYLGFPGPHVDALYFHVSRAVHGHPFGSVTVLDYAASAQDAERFAARTRREAAPHVRQVIKHYRTHVQIDSILNFIKILRESR